MIIKVKPKAIECKLLAEDNFSPKDCKTLLAANLSDLIEIMTIPITNVGSLKIEAFKLGFEWVEEKEWITFTMNENRVLKISPKGKWIQINPNLKQFNRDINIAVFNLLNLLPDKFSILLGNEPIQLNSLRPV